MRIKRWTAFLLLSLILFSTLTVTAGAEVLPEPPQVPRIEIVTEDGNGTALEKADGYVDASVTITDTDGSVLQDDCSFKVRGNTTSLSFIPKKPYTFKFSKKKDVLGMGKGKKWVLLANMLDTTLLRNYMTFEAAQYLDLPYTSNQRYVELWLDGEYRGCYTLYEPVQEGKDRVDIDIESNDGKKDFLIEYEALREEEDVTYFTTNGLRFIASEPDEPDDDQLSYIKSTMSDIIYTIRMGTREEIEQKIDVPSFVSFYLLNEYVKNLDFDMSSVYFFYKDGKLYAGPVWDFDMSCGNLNNQSVNPRVVTASKPDGISQNKNIYQFLCQTDWFYDEVREAYRRHHDYFTNISADGGLLDQLREENAALFARNFTVWRVNHYLVTFQKRPLKTYEENFDFLKSWLTERNDWLTDHFFGYYVGDADQNGEVDAVDAVMTQRFTLDIIQPTFDQTAADVDNDGEPTVVDATFIQRYTIDLYTPHPIGERKLDL